MQQSSKSEVFRKEILWDKMWLVGWAGSLASFEIPWFYSKSRNLHGFFFFFFSADVSHCFIWAHFAYRGCHPVMLPPTCTWGVWNPNAIFHVLFKKVLFKWVLHRAWIHDPEMNQLHAPPTEPAKCPSHTFNFMFISSTSHLFLPDASFRSYSVI